MKLTKKSVVAVSIIVTGVVGGLVAWLVGGGEPAAANFSDKSPEQIAEYLQPEEFRNLDRGVRRSRARQAMEQMMTIRAREYSELPAAQQVAYLDKVIDDMQSRRREFGARRRGFEGRRGDNGFRRREFAGGREGAESRGGEFQGGREQTRPRWDAGDGSQRPRRRGRRRSPERRRARSEFVDPKTRAQRAKFREALRQRMRERGMDFRSGRR
jgi:hypothetical protein